MSHLSLNSSYYKKQELGEDYAFKNNFIFFIYFTDWILHHKLFLSRKGFAVSPWYCFRNYRG